MPTWARMRRDGVPVHQHPTLNNPNGRWHGPWTNHGDTSSHDPGAHDREGAASPRWTGRYPTPEELEAYRRAILYNREPQTMQAQRTFERSRRNLRNSGFAYGGVLNNNYRALNFNEWNDDSGVEDAEATRQTPEEVASVEATRSHAAEAIRILRDTLGRGSVSREAAFSEPMPERPVLDEQPDFWPTLTTRRWGVEIECLTNLEALKEYCAGKGVVVKGEEYNHTVRHHWKSVSDSSVHHTTNRDEHERLNLRPQEIVSPPLSGTDGLIQLKILCDGLKAVHSRVNVSCGLHVHHDATDVTPEQAKRVGLNYHAAQKGIDKLVSPSRRSAIAPVHCRAFDTWELSTIRNAVTWRDLYGNLDRYRNVNYAAYERHHTLEFRQHQGTVEFQKIAAWIWFTQTIMEKSISGLIYVGSLPIQEPKMFMTALGLDQDGDLRTYLVQRQNALGREREIAAERS